MSERRECKLGEIVLTNLNTIGKDYLHSDILYLDTGSITQNKIESLQNLNIKNAPSRAKRLTKVGDTIYSTVRPIHRHFGYISKTIENLVVSTGFTVVTPVIDKIDSLFLYYFLSSNEVTILLDMVAEASTSTYPSIRPEDIENLEISLPPLPTQKAIANTLSSLDAKIDLLHKQNNTLEQLAQTVFRQWFIEERDDSWEECSLIDEFTLVMGQSPNGSNLNEVKNGIIFYQGSSDFGFRFPSERVYTNNPKKIAEQFDTLVSVRAPVGALNMALSRCCIGRGVAAIRHISNPEFYTYTYYKINSLLSHIKKFNDEGTVFGSIGKDDFGAIQNFIPKYSIVLKFQKEVKKIDDKIYNNSLQINTLIKLRDTLLPKLMSGEVSVKEK